MEYENLGYQYNISILLYFIILKVFCNFTRSLA